MQITLESDKNILANVAGIHIFPSRIKNIKNIFVSRYTEYISETGNHQ